MEKKPVYSLPKEIKDKFESALLAGCTIAEACLFAGLSGEDYSEHCKNNPGYFEKCELLRDQPVIDSRFTLAKSVKENADMAHKYLKAKRKDEFSERSEHTGRDGEALQISVTNYSELQQKEVAKRILDSEPVDEILNLHVPKKLQNNKK